MEQENGEAIVYEYYDLAPTIVKHIDQRKDAKEIYRTHNISEWYISQMQI